MTGREVAIGSRGSPLALAQADLVAQALHRAGQVSRVVIVETDGDRRTPDTAWGEGAFVAAIERALLTGEVDVAVHSAKDVPTREDARLSIGAYLPRADPRDALVVRTDSAVRRLDDLPAGARVGTDSPRRTGFLRARRPDLVIHPLHGNVDTRLRRLEAGETDALVLACAGLDRLGLGDRIAERLEPSIVPPAPGQGAIAAQSRREDAATVALLARIDDRPTRKAVEVERAFLAASGGGCRSPIGALATFDGEELDVLGAYARPDGSGTVFARRRGPASSAAALARDLAAELDRGVRARALGGRILVTRAAGHAEELMSGLRAAGLDPIHVPTIAVEMEPAGADLDVAAASLPGYDWVVITSANGARAILAARARTSGAGTARAWATIGPATRKVLEDAGVAIAFQPTRSTGAVLAAELPIEPGSRILVVRGDLADGGLAVALRARGAFVDDVIGYRTREAPAASGALLRRALADGAMDAVIFTSGSTVRGLLALVESAALELDSIPAVCIGAETADHARRAGFRVLAVSPTPDVAGLVHSTSGALRNGVRETR